ncbi:MAG: hypothetical protein A4E73_00393 [Syntrophaceae bacterium PtaU1.Bin231]|nr:MAG: hypothetical protein A4E73_00393 [Syntrophaceae bacterium PtaU1.Bin231]
MTTGFARVMFVIAAGSPPSQVKPESTWKQSSLSSGQENALKYSMYRFVVPLIVRLTLTQTSSSSSPGMTATLSKLPPVTSWVIILDQPPISSDRS